MRRRRHALQVTTFPFLAVLLCAMGSLILLLLVIDRRAKVVARAKAMEAVLKAEADDALAAAQAAAQAAAHRDASRAAELEQRRQALHALLDRENHEVLTKVQGIQEKAKETEQAARSEKERSRDLQAMLQAELAKLSQAEQELTSRKTEIEKRLQVAEASQSELAGLTADLLQLERTLADLKSLSQRDQQTYSLVPFHGKHGDKRKPIYVECAFQKVVFHPDRLALNSWLTLRSEMRAEVQRRLDKKKASGDGKEAPYLLLLIRPDGVLTYYQVLDGLSDLKIDFGYEFIEKDWALDFPDDPQNFRPQPWMLAEKPVAPRDPNPLKVAVAGTPRRHGLVHETGPGGSGGGYSDGAAGSALNPGNGQSPPGMPGSTGSGADKRVTVAYSGGQEGNSPTAGMGGGASVGNGLPGGTGTRTFPSGAGEPSAGTGVGQGRNHGSGGEEASPFDLPGNQSASGGLRSNPGHLQGTGNAVSSSTGFPGSGTGYGASKNPGSGGEQASPFDLGVPGHQPDKGGSGGDPAGFPIGKAGAPGLGTGQGGNPTSGQGTSQGSSGAGASPGGTAGSSSNGAGPSVAADGGQTAAEPEGSPGQGRGAGAGNNQQGATGANKTGAGTTGSEVGRSDNSTSTGSQTSSEPSEGGGSQEGSSREAPAPGIAGLRNDKVPASENKSVDQEADEPRLPSVALGPPTVEDKRPQPVRPGWLAGNREWVIPIECKADALVIGPGRTRIPLETLGQGGSDDNPLAKAVRQLIDRRQSMVRPGEKPYRPMIRFQVHPDGLCAYYQAWPALESLHVPMSRENWEPANVKK